MNDDELFEQLSAQRKGIPMTVPVERVIRRGRAIRARRRMTGLATVAAAICAAAVVVPLSHSPDHTPTLQLAAWTVSKQADGTVDVTIRELRDPTGLQQTLRVDGIPASVIFGDGPSTGSGPCQSYGHGQLLSQVVTPSNAQPDSNARAMAIHPSAIPSDAGIQIITNQTNVGIHLVVASSECTG